MFKRIEDYFIGHHLHSTDDVFEHARAIMMLRFSLSFFVLFFFPVIVDFVLDYDKLLWFHMVILVSIISFPFAIRGVKKLDTAINLFFTISLMSSITVFLIVNPMKVEVVGLTWIIFFAGTSALMQRGWARVLFCCFLLWVPVIYVMINVALNGALTIEAILQKNAANPPMFMVILPIFLLIFAVWYHTITIDKARKLITTQKNEIENQNKDITDSITYARHLQEALLPPLADIRSAFPLSAVYYRPKAIVAGDFYWMEKSGDRTYIAAADCTGHGVPGAMVSVVCSGALTRAVREFNLEEPGMILDKTRELVIETFATSGNTVNDGMDISLLCVHRSTGQITWSGANNPLWICDGKTLHTVRPDKQPVGRNEQHHAFTTHNVSIPSGSAVYLFTDGLADQFGGPDGKKFKYKQLGEFFVSNHHLPAEERIRALDHRFNQWKDNLEQVDDVCILAIDFR